MFTISVIYWQKKNWQMRLTILISNKNKYNNEVHYSILQFPGHKYEVKFPIFRRNQSFIHWQYLYITVTRFRDHKIFRDASDYVYLLKLIFKTFTLNWNCIENITSTSSRHLLFFTIYSLHILRVVRCTKTCKTWNKEKIILC